MGTVTATETASDQLRLMPDTPPTTELGIIALDALPPDEALVGPPPSAQLVASVRAFGVLQPVWIDLDGSLIAGRRRVKAARIAGLTEVPAVRVLDRGTVGDVLTVAEHVRRENPAAQLAAVESLLAEGADEAQIARATGVPRGKIKRVLRLRALVSGLRDAYMAGKLTTGAAEAAARLAVGQQAVLAERVAGGFAVTARDVDHLRRAKVVEAARALPFDLIAAMPGSVEEAVDPVRSAAGALLAEVDKWLDKHNSPAMLRAARELRAAMTGEPKEEAA